MIDMPPAASCAAPAGKPAGYVASALPATVPQRRSIFSMRALAAGAIVVLVAFVTVQAGGCGFKTPLQLPKKAAPAKPAS
jgi:predicted small lipoprotein YifL